MLEKCEKTFIFKIENHYVRIYKSRTTFEVKCHLLTRKVEWIFSYERHKLTLFARPSMFFCKRK